MKVLIHFNRIKIANLYLLFLLLILTINADAQLNRNQQLYSIAEPTSELELFTFKNEINISAEEFVKNNLFILELTPNSEMRLIRSEKDELGFTNSRYQQYLNNHKVLGGEMIIHEKDGRIQYINGMYLQINPQNSNVLINEYQGLQNALKEIKSVDYLWLNVEAEANYRITKKDSTASLFPKGELIYIALPGLPKENKVYRLCWKYSISVNPATESYDVYIDAATGTVQNKIPLTFACNGGSSTTLWNGLRTIYTLPLPPLGFMLQNICNPSVIHTVNGNGNDNGAGATEYIDNDNIWPNTALGRYVAQAHFSSQQVRNYYVDIHDREGYDNSGHIYKTYLNPGYTGNAFYRNSTQAVSFGGNADGSNPFVTIDVVGHEHTHGMVNFTSNLTYAGESGALNESFADCLGEAVEAYTLGTNDWLIAGELGTIRSFVDPNSKSQPDTYLGTNWYTTVACTPTGANDFCGVHINSGVQNYWFYLLSVGGAGTNDLGFPYCVNGIGIEKARMIAYRCMLNLTSVSGYGNARLVSIQAAKDIYGVNSNEALQTANAWCAVGVGPSQNLPPNPTIVIASSSNNFCEGSIANVTFTATPTNAISPSYQWIVNGIIIPGANSSTYSSTTLNDDDSIRCVMTFIPACSFYTNSMSSNTIYMTIFPVNNVVINTTVTPATICEGGTTNLSASVNYCIPNYSLGSSSGDYIGRVVILDDDGNPTGFDNISTGAPFPYYTQYPASGNTTTTLFAGEYYRLKLAAGTNTSLNYLAAWIDFNRDSLFSDDEKVKQVGPVGAYPDMGPYFGTIVIPNYVINGLTRMRIREVRNGVTIEPCDAAIYGETEDYFITLANGAPSIPLLFNWSAGTSPSIGATVAASPAYSQQYTVTVTNSYGCTASAKTNPVIVNSMNIKASASPVIVCPNAATTLTANVGSNYCNQFFYGTGTANGNYISSIQISDVTLGGFGTPVMIFSSGPSSAPYYTLFPASGNSTTTLIAGHTYKLFLSTGTASNNMVTAFIDYDSNINLNAGLEKLGEKTIGASSSSFMTFTVPLSAKNGTTRFRIRLSGDGYYLESCEFGGSGETEDYTITISGGVNNVQPAYTWSPTTTPISGSSVTAYPTTSTNFIVTATDADGCIATASTPVLVTLPPALTVDASPSAICAGESSTLSASTNSINYCQPAYTSGTSGGDFISSVYMFNTTLSNFTGASASPFYTLFPQSGGSTATLTAGNGYYLTINVGSFTSFNNVAAWIDYNGDGTWFGPLEKLGESGDINTAYGSASLLFFVPTWAKNGTCRLRIRETYNTYNLDPCATYTFGETEDYNITITGGVDPSTTTFVWTPLTIPSTGNSVIASPTSETTYTVTATGNYGCSSSVSTQVNMKTNAQFYSNASSICEGTPTEFNASVNSCSGNAFYGNGSSYAATLIGSYATTAVNNITIEAWVKWNGATGSNQFIYYNGNSNLNGYGIIVNAGNANKLTVYLGGVAALNSTITLSPNVWQHVAVTKGGPTGGTWRLFVDGTLYSLTSSNTIPLTPGFGGTYVGRSNNLSEYFNGAIDEVRIWSTAISSFLIPNERVACISAPQTNLVGYWKFNELIGSTILCADESGGNRTLTLSNANARTVTANYAWNYGDTTTGNGINSSHTYPASGTYITTLTVTDITGCSASSTKSIFVNPCIVSLNLTLFIQGYHQGSGSMNTALANEGIGTSNVDIDSVTVELHDAVSPYGIVQTSKGILQVNGNLICPFSFGVFGNSYYVAIKHRNSIETWSKLPVTFNSTSVYFNFSSQ